MSDHDHGENGEFDGVTYLYIRTNPADDGSTPLAAGLKHWISPDILIQKPDGGIGTEAIGGETNTVLVTVTNAGGIDAIDAYVDVFFANPSTAFTPATAIPIGSDFVSIAGYSSQTLQFPWMPSASDVGHRCLLARVCMSAPFDCYMNGAIFDVKGDRHVAQRNIHVLEMAAEEDLENFGFGFDIVNPLIEPAEFVIQVTELRGRRDLEFLQQALQCKSARFAERPLEKVGLILTGEVEPRDPSVTETKRELPVGLIREAIRGQGTEMALQLEPDTVLGTALTISRSREVSPGTYHVLEITQRDMERDVIVGGLWVIVAN